MKEITEREKRNLLQSIANFFRTHSHAGLGVKGEKGKRVKGEEGKRGRGEKGKRGRG